MEKMYPCQGFFQGRGCRGAFAPLEICGFISLTKGKSVCMTVFCPGYLEWWLDSTLHLVLFIKFIFN